MNSSYPQSYLPISSLLPSYRDPVPFGGDGAGEERRVQMVVSRRMAVVSDNTCQTASRGLARSLKPVFTRGEVLATVDSLMGLAVGLRCGGNV